MILNNAERLNNRNAPFYIYTMHVSSLPAVLTHNTLCLRNVTRFIDKCNASMR